MAARFRSTTRYPCLSSAHSIAEVIPKYPATSEPSDPSELPQFGTPVGLRYSSKNLRPVPLRLSTANVIARPVGFGSEDMTKLVTGSVAQVVVSQAPE